MNIPPLAQLAFCAAVASLLAAFAPIVVFDAPVWLITLEAVIGAAFFFARCHKLCAPQNHCEPELTGYCDHACD